LCGLSIWEEDDLEKAKARRNAADAAIVLISPVVEHPNHI
jgi:hypothetical protein